MEHHSLTYTHHNKEKIIQLDNNNDNDNDEKTPLLLIINLSFVCVIDRRGAITVIVASAL